MPADKNQRNFTERVPSFKVDSESIEILSMTIDEIYSISNAFFDAAEIERTSGREREVKRAPHPITRDSFLLTISKAKAR